MVGDLARLYGKVNYLTLCGLLADSMTDPHPGGQRHAPHQRCQCPVYATVYPLVVFLRITQVAGHPALGWRLI